MNNNNWKPTISLENLRKRAKIIQQIRHFFDEKNVLEVETPMMSDASISDLNLHPFSTQWKRDPNANEKTLYLMTSPEFHMKRLLAAGFGSMYQISRCFRNEEIGDFHNPEFTLLEWYQIDFSMFDLINEVDELLQLILQTNPAEKLTYQNAFLQHLQIDPISISHSELKLFAKNFNLSEFALENSNKDALLQFLFSRVIEPKIGIDRPIVIYDFPANQAALAKINPENPNVAKRFEFYFKQIELANGFEELSNPNEQKIRFEQEIKERKKANLPDFPIDFRLISALKSGLPNCSGVALGIDRLILLALNCKQISDVICFPADRA